MLTSNQHPTEPSISVIVAVHNAAATLPNCLEALCNQTRGPDEIIVVDDASTDDTPQLARRCGTLVIATRRQSGLAAARNLGVHAARGDIVVFTDAGCSLALDWLEQLARPFFDAQGHPTGVIGVQGAYRTHQRTPLARYVQQEYEYKYARMVRRPQIDFVATYSAAYRRDVLLDNGGFDPAFRTPSVEDQELSFRLARKGYTMVFAPAAIVYHQHDRSVGEYCARKASIGYWKALMLHWLPEKLLSDSYAPSQHSQIALLAVGSLSLLAGTLMGWPGGGLLAAACLLLFFLTALPFLAQVHRRDPQLLPLVPLMLLCRAATLGAGLLAGVAFPPHRWHTGFYTSPSIVRRALKRLFHVASAAR